MIQLGDCRFSLLAWLLLVGVFARNCAEPVVTDNRAHLSADSEPDIAYTDGYEYTPEEVASYDRLRHERLQLSQDTASARLSKRSDWGKWACMSPSSGMVVGS